MTTTTPGFGYWLERHALHRRGTTAADRRQPECASIADAATSKIDQELRSRTTG